MLEKRRYAAEEVSIVFLTSGTTGFPKLVEYPAAACAQAGRHFARHWSITDKDVIATIAPASRGPNVTAYYAAPYVAAKTVMMPWTVGRDSLKLIERKKVTIACLVPTQLAKMLQDYEIGSYDLSSLRLWVSAGSILPPTLGEQVEKKMGGIIVNQYGAVDFGIMAITVPEDDFATRMYTVGKPRFDDAIKIFNDKGREVSRGKAGEVMAKGPCCSSGYFKDLKATKEVWNAQGWYASGDLGRIDEDGNLVLAGRKKELIIRGGQNIIPSEIEHLIMTHPKVKDVAVVAMPDDLMGEKACAYVVAKKKQTILLAEVVSFLKQQGIAPYKLPERIEILDKLPTTEGQKVDKKALVRDIIKKIESERD
jgi:non-ribosomal peptide synthetase component E (peptide arylation enzyme)